MQDPQKAYIFNANYFLYVLQKKSRKKLCLEPHDAYVLFITLFCQLNNKLFFLIWAVPLIYIINFWWEWMYIFIECTIYIFLILMLGLGLYETRSSDFNMTLHLGAWMGFLCSSHYGCCLSTLGKSWSSTSKITDYQDQRGREWNSCKGCS